MAKHRRGRKKKIWMKCKVGKRRKGDGWHATMCRRLGGKKKKK